MLTAQWLKKWSISMWRSLYIRGPYRKTSSCFSLHHFWSFIHPFSFNSLFPPILSFLLLLCCLFRKIYHLLRRFYTPLWDMAHHFSFQMLVKYRHRLETIFIVKHMANYYFAMTLSITGPLNVCLGLKTNSSCAWRQRVGLTGDRCGDLGPIHGRILCEWVCV